MPKNTGARPGLPRIYPTERECIDVRRLTIFVALLAILTSACRAEVLTSLDVNKDGSGTLTMEVGVDKELENLMNTSGGSPGDMLSQIGPNDIPGAKPIQRTEGDLTYFGVEVPFDDPATVANLLTTDAQGQSLFQTFDLTVENGASELRATMSVPTSDLGNLPIDPSQLTGDFFTARFVVSLPGKIVESNADETLSDGRLSWNLPIVGGEKEIYAKSSASGGFPGWVWIVLIVVLIIAVAAIVAVVIDRRRRAERAIDEADGALLASPLDGSPADTTGDPPTDPWAPPPPGSD